MTEELLERDLQAKCVAWWNRSGIPGLLFHVPNQGKRDRLDAASLGAMGVVAGVSDLVLVLPDGKVAFIELKAQGGRLSHGQHSFLNRMEELGHQYRAVWSLSDFQDTARELSEWATQ